MILIGVGTNRDKAVSETVDVMRRSSNAFLIELHHPVRLPLHEIATVLEAAEDKRVFIVSHGSQTALLDSSLERTPYLRYQDTNIGDVPSRVEIRSAGIAG